MFAKSNISQITKIMRLRSLNLLNKVLSFKRLSMSSTPNQSLIIQTLFIFFRPFITKSKFIFLCSLLMVLHFLITSMSFQLSLNKLLVILRGNLFKVFIIFVLIMLFTVILNPLISYYPKMDKQKLQTLD